MQLSGTQHTRDLQQTGWNLLEQKRTYLCMCMCVFVFVCGCVYFTPSCCIQRSTGGLYPGPETCRSLFCTKRLYGCVHDTHTQTERERERETIVKTFVLSQFLSYKYKYKKNEVFVPMSHLIHLKPDIDLHLFTLLLAVKRPIHYLGVQLNLFKKKTHRAQ